MDKWAWENNQAWQYASRDLPRHERRGQVDVLGNRQVHIKLGVDGVGTGQNRRASIQGGDDACLGNRDRLLFLHGQLSHPVLWCEARAYHHFVQHGSCVVRHLVKLINAAYAAVTQDQRTTSKQHKHKARSRLV